MKLNWAQNLPKNWEVKSLKMGFRFTKGKNSATYTKDYVNNPLNMGIYPVYSGQTESEGILGNIKIFDYNLSQPVIFSTTVGAKAMTPRLLSGKFNLSQNCLLMIPHENIDANYFYYQTRVIFDIMKSEIPSHMQPSLRIGDFGKFFALYPPMEEQKKIAIYLDQKVAKIDEAIAKKKQLINLLEEKKSLMISHTVNGCKNKKRLKRITKNIILKKTLSEKIYMLENIESWTGKILGQTMADDVSGELINFKKDDVLFGKLRPYLAKVMKAEESGSCSGEFLVLRSSEEIESKYLFYKLISKDFIDQVNSATYGTKMPRASWDIIGNMLIDLPTIKEQRDMIKKFDGISEQIEKTTNKINDSIHLLEEYKISLISNAVTGRMRV